MSRQTTYVPLLHKSADGEPEAVGNREVVLVDDPRVDARVRRGPLVRRESRDDPDGDGDEDVGEQDVEPDLHGQSRKGKVASLRVFQCTGPKKMVCKTYLRRTQAGPSRRVKEQHKGISPNHVRAIFSPSVEFSMLVEGFVALKWCHSAKQWLHLV